MSKFKNMTVRELMDVLSMAHPDARIFASVITPHNESEGEFCVGVSDDGRSVYFSTEDKDHEDFALEEELFALGEG